MVAPAFALAAAAAAGLGGALLGHHKKKRDYNKSYLQAATDKYRTSISEIGGLRTNMIADLRAQYAASGLWPTGERSIEKWYTGEAGKLLDTYDREWGNVQPKPKFHKKKKGWFGQILNKI